MLSNMSCLKNCDMYGNTFSYLVSVIQRAVNLAIRLLLSAGDLELLNTQKNMTNPTQAKGDIKIINRVMLKMPEPHARPSSLFADTTTNFLIRYKPYPIAGSVWPSGPLQI
jgi:hypothetical protein